MAITCPCCNLKNPDTAERCDCGYQFVGASSSSKGSSRPVLRDVDRVGGVGVRYDEAIIVSFAERLYRSAARTIVTSTVAGFLLGASPAAYWYSTRSSVTPVFIVTAVVGILIGFLIGQELAFKLRLLAQTALCQAQIERNTRRA